MIDGIDRETAALFVVLAGMATNQLVMRVPLLLRTGPVFWALQAGNVGLGLWIAARGLPGFDALPSLSVLVGLLFLFHVATNVRLRIALLRDEEEDREDAEAAEVARILAARAAHEAAHQAAHEAAELREPPG